MERLKELGLKDGDLMPLRSPHLIDRYNRALERLTGRRTALAAFHVDATGYSQEVAEELSDPEYLNPLGVNRKFILVSIHQKDLPVLDASFSSTRAMMKEFVERNEAALFTLTSKDAVYGELEDDTFKVETLDDLLSIKTISFSVNSASGVAEKAAELSRLVEEYGASDAMWADDARLARMAELARHAGDVRRNPSVPRALVFSKGNFWTKHLGGLYVWRTDRGITVIHEDPAFQSMLRWQGRDVRAIRIDDVDAVVDFLVDAGLIHVPTADFVRARKEVLLQKLEFLVMHEVSAMHPDADLSNFSKEETKSFIYQHHDRLPREFHELTRALKFCCSGLEWDDRECDSRAIAYMARAVAGPDRELVYHLLANLMPADYLNAYLFNRRLFYRRYEGWNAARKSYVTDFLHQKFGGRSGAVWDAVYGFQEGAPPPSVEADRRGPG